MTALPLDRAGFAALRWRVDERNPLIGPPWPSPVVADPTLVVPEQSPDGRWHLFAHSLLGIHHYTSLDGVVWRRGRTVVRNALRAHVVRNGDTYHLLYEKPRAMVPVGPLPWASRIDVRSSRDLVTWSRPRTLLRPSLDWHEEPGRGRAVGNPCLVRTEDGWRLYYSAGLVFLEDCGFCEPRYVGVAEGPTPVGPFRPLPDPILGPDPADRWTNQGAGAIKAVAVADGWVALQNGIYLDPATGHSGSALLVLDSPDGLSWSRSREAPLLAPGAPEWMRSHVYAVDLGHSGEELVLYFNARNDWHWRKGRESIGRAVAGPVTRAPASPRPRMRADE